MTPRLCRCALAAALLLACGRSSKKADTQPPPDPVTGIRVGIHAPLKLAWNDANCAASSEGIKTEVADRIRAALSRAGFVVHSSESAEVDTELHASFVLQTCTKRGVYEGTLTIALEPGATVSDFIEVEYDWETSMIEDLQRSPQVIALKGRAASGSTAPAKPAATPPATAPAFQTGAPQLDTYALVIGIERYRDVPAATGARADAELFARLAHTTLGVPERNIRLLLDDRAGKADIDKELAWLAANTPANARILLYYSGHGSPEAAKGTPYLVPFDGDPKALATTALALADILKKLSETKAKDVLAITDACFAGAGGRSVLPPGARPLVRVAEAPASPRVALFAAASGSEFSGPAAEGGGLFTRTLIEGLGTGQADIDGDGNITLREAREWIGPRVAREAKRDNREQTPNVALGEGVHEDGFFLAFGVTRAQ